MTECPDDAALLGALVDGVSDELEAHLDGCADCRRVLAAGARSAEVGEGTGMGRYVLERLLGVGGMGVVYAARDSALGRTVAVKVLRARAAERLQREAQVMARLANPYVVHVYDLGEVDGRAFIAMEYLDGGTLRQWLERPRRVDETVALLQLAGQGLGAAHEAGIVHRDFKPENVLLGSDGRPRVCDFGLANWREGAVPEGTVSVETVGLLGTPAYMAPEQLEGAPADARSDQFAFCVVLFEALTGRRPWQGRTVSELRDQLRSAPLERPPLPTFVWAVLERGLARAPSARFASMHELLAALRPQRRRGVTWGLALVALTSALAITGVVLWPAAEAPPSPPAGPVRPHTPPHSATSASELIVEPDQAEALPPEGGEIVLEPQTPRSFRASELVRVRLGDGRVLDAEALADEVKLTGLAVGNTALTLEFRKHSRTPERHALSVGERIDVTLHGMTRITIGNAAIVDVARTAIGARFIARGAGTTNALIWTNNAIRHEYRFEVSVVNAQVIELEVGVQRVLTVDPLGAVSVEPADLCEALQLNATELLLTPRRRGTGLLTIARGELVEERELIVFERH